MNWIDAYREPGPVPLPDPVVDANGNPVVCTCPVCGAMCIGAPPHGDSEPCPAAIELKAAQIRANEATAMMGADFYALVRKMGLSPDDEDE